MVAVFHNRYPLVFIITQQWQLYSLLCPVLSPSGNHLNISFKQLHQLGPTKPYASVIKDFILSNSLVLIGTFDWDRICSVMCLPLTIIYKFMFQDFAIVTCRMWFLIVLSRGIGDLCDERDVVKEHVFLQQVLYH